MNVFLGFKDGKLVTVLESKIDNFESAIDVDYIIANPEDVEKQITEWRKLSKLPT